MNKLQITNDKAKRTDNKVHEIESCDVNRYNQVNNW